MTGTPVVYPVDVGDRRDQVLHRRRRRHHLALRPLELRARPTGSASSTSTSTTARSTRTRHSTSWNDGQPLQVPPVLSLDPAGNVVLNVASGTTDQFDTTGIEYVYSITEQVSTLGGAAKLRANVNWWMQPAVLDNLAGERVSGPMTVFNGTLYFSTFAARARRHAVVQRGNGAPLGPRLRDPRGPDLRCGRNVQPRSRRSAGDAAAAAQRADGPSAELRRAGPLRHRRWPARSSRACPSRPRRPARASARPGSDSYVCGRDALGAAELHPAGRVLALHAGRSEGRQRLGDQAVPDGRAHAGVPDAHRLVGGGARVKRQRALLALALARARGAACSKTRAGPRRGTRRRAARSAPRQRHAGGPPRAGRADRGHRARVRRRAARGGSTVEQRFATPSTRRAP